MSGLALARGTRSIARDADFFGGKGGVLPSVHVVACVVWWSPVGSLSPKVSMEGRHASFDRL